MVINVTNREADALARKFADMEGVSISDAIIIAMTEAIERRRRSETSQQAASRLRTKHGITLTETARKPLPKSVFDAIWEDG